MGQSSELRNSVQQLFEQLRMTGTWAARNVTPIVAITSLILYAGFWTDSVIFYARLGLNPANAGLTPADILGRSVSGFIVLGGVLTVLASMVAVTLVVAASLVIAVTHSRRSPYRSVFEVALTVLLIGVAVFVPDNNLTRTFATAVVALGAAFAFIWHFGVSASGAQFSAIAILGAIALATLGLTTSYALSASDSIRRGEPAEYTFRGVPVTPWTARPVALTWSPQAPESFRSAPGNCAIYLGEAGGVTVLYLPAIQEVLRVPSGLVVMQTFPEVLACKPQNLFKPRGFFSS